MYEPETYQLRGMEGFRHIWAHKPDGRAFRRKVKSIDPLSTEYAGLFLEFARWFDKQKMDKSIEWEPGYGATLDTPRNGDAALAWAREYGVLGLGVNPGSSFSVSSINSSSSEIAAERLGMPELGHSGTRAYRKSPAGGQHETVEMFVMEAYEANVVLKLYEAATTKPVNVTAIARYMSNRRYREFTERDVHSQNADLARSWALRVVEHTVDSKVEHDVYPLLVGEPDSYEEAWGFKSLLGAMWFQMRRFMLNENNLCPECGQAYYKTRRDKTFCSESCGDRARARRNYHEGRGASSKQARKAKRYRREG